MDSCRSSTSCKLLCAAALGALSASVLPFSYLICSVLTPDLFPPHDNPPLPSSNCRGLPEEQRIVQWVGAFQFWIQIWSVCVLTDGDPKRRLLLFNHQLWRSACSQRDVDRFLVYRRLGQGQRAMQTLKG